ncbi:MAG: hypothetical protein ACJ76H_13730 [Bacteriovoracaceae bacterium]
MKYIIFVLLSSLAFADDPGGSAGQCQSQLMRMQVDSNAISGLLHKTDELEKRALPAIRTYLDSDRFKKSFITDWPLPSVGFPFNIELCKKEKARDEKFKDVDCSNWNLCGDPSYSEEIKRRICFALPCSFMMGSHMDKCPSDASARPKNINFTTPLALKQLDLVPENVTLEGNVVRSCFKVNAMKVVLSVGIDFDKNGTDYENIGLNNLDVTLDSQKEVCLDATIDLSKKPILSNVHLRPVGDAPFVSNAMIDRSLRGSTVVGLSGYTPETLDIAKLSALPPLARYFRPTVENAIANVLSTQFEKTVSNYLGGVSFTGGPTRMETPSDSMISELGVGNIAVRKYVDLLDCAMMKAEKTPIAADNSCYTSSYPGRISNNYSLKNLPKVDDAIKMLKETVARNSNVTSESIRARLEGMGPRFQKLGLAGNFSRDIVPLTERIKATQSSSTLMSGIELVGNLSNDSQLSVGFCVPDICDKQKASTHENRSIPNCPIQTYVDINELNNLMKAMYDSGRLCHRGQGDFVVAKNGKGEIARDKSGFAVGQGCVFAIEEDPDGLRCYLNGPPTMKFDPATKRYNVSLSTRECLRGGVFVGLGKIGGDINFNIGFTPTICNGGDFCLENGEADWNVVPGTAKYALRDSSWLHGAVKSRIDSNLREMVSSTIRFPLTSGSGPLANVPVVPEGRTDMGNGYFGACLKVK